MNQEERPEPAGTICTNNGMEFAVAVPKGKECVLYLYRSKGKKPYRKVKMEENLLYGNVRFSGLQTGIKEGDEYSYRINGKSVVDPYAHRIQKYIEQTDTGVQEEERGVLSFSKFNWKDDMPLCIPDEDVVAYSLHIRGFTKGSGSKVKNKGTFLGIIEKIPYLKELGINQIQCMPIYEFDDEIRLSINYWGYGKAYCFAPKRKYAHENPLTELKEMIRSCHKAGIEVVFYLPFYEEMPKQKMLECLRYYRQEFHIDGFIVNPYIAPIDVIKSDDYLKNIKLIVKKEEFQNEMRRFLKGDEGMIESVIWHQKHLCQKENSYNYISDHTGFTLNDLVSYDGKHNEANGENNQDGPNYNYSWNCGVEGKTRKKAVVRLREQQMRNAFFLLLFAQGTPCILAGDEFGNSQNGNNNVYCQDNETAWLDWKKAEKEKWLFEYVKSLISFRKSHKLFHPSEECKGVDRTHCGIPDISYHGENAWQIPNEIYSRQLGIFYCDSSDQKETFYITYNMHWEEHEFALPSLPKNTHWKQIFTTEIRKGFLDCAVDMGEKRKVAIPPRSISMFKGVVDGKSEEKME
nr:alpha-amylase family glycosyl hydrolase [uncultured Sellimonas sp.]